MQIFRIILYLCRLIFLIQKINIHKMKKLFLSIFLLLAIAILAEAQNYTIHSSDYNSVSLNFKTDIPTVGSIKTPEGMFSTLTMSDFNPSHVVGNPQLPVLSKLLEIPLCDSVIATVLNAQYEEYDAAALGILHPIYPVQTNYPKSYTGDKPFNRNNEVYSTNDYYAEPLVRVEKTGTLRDITLATIYFSPIQYNPVTNRIRICHSVDVEVTYVNANIPGTYELKNKYGSPAFQVGASSVINPMGTRNEFTNAPIKYLIIANSMFANNEQLNQFIQWKKRIGYIVDVAYTSDPAVGTTTTSIKNYIMAQYNNATPENPAPTFLLLIGDVAQLPPFSCNTSNSHVSDLYYATWTTGDNLPDCYYGRFSAQNVSQLVPQIEKTLMYEQYTMDDPSYLGKAVLIAGSDANWAPTHADGQINYIYNNYINTNSTTHNYTTVYKHNYNCSSQAATIRSEIGTGVGWANYTAHGGEDGWSDPSFNNSHVSAMQNEGKYGIMIGNCCLTGKFNYSSDCFAEVLLRTANKGAVAYIGGSEVTYWPQDYYWAVGARANCTANPTYDASKLGSYDRVFHTHGENASVWTSSISAFMQGGNLSVEASNSDATDKKYYWEIYHLFGDPSLRPYLGIPTQQNVNANDVIVVGATTYHVDASPYAYVALTHNNNLVTATFADGNGSADLTLNASLEPGEYELAVEAQNKIQFFKTVNVIVPQGAYITTSALELSPISVPNNGSTVSWDLTVQNLGNVNAAAAYAKLTTSTSGVQILVDSVFLGNIASSSTKTVNTAFQTILPADAEDGTIANFTVTVYWGASSSTKNTTLTINAPKLVLDNHTIQTTSDASVIAPGDLVTVTCVNKNVGHATLPQGLVDLTSNYTGAVVTTSSYSIYTLQPEQTTNNVFTVQIGNDVPINTIIPLVYHIIYGNKHFKDTIFLTIGTAMETFETGNFTEFPWNNNSNKPWEITTTSPYSGNNCARSASGLGNNVSSTLSITVNASQAGNVSFFRKVSSEQNWDKFTFAIDGAVMDEQSGTVQWSQVSFPVAVGSHTYTFKYTKDYSSNAGSDCAWIDNVVFPGYGTMAPQDTNDFVGISDYSIPSANVTVYPNPTSGQLTVSSNEAIRMISIYDLSGRLVETITVNADTQANLNVARLNSGVYFIKTQLENQQTKTSKFIKQ